MSSLSERASIIPGKSLTRSKKVFGRWTCGRADGAVIWDADGRPYIDTTCALGAISLGYPDCETWREGVYSLPHYQEIEAAEAVLKHVAPWARSVRFTKTGSEATHAAYRIAKKATGLNAVLVAEGAYHGWHEWCEQACRYQMGDDLSAVATQAAAIFVEPFRFQPMDREWLQALRRWCIEGGALLVFDSMIYGGRFALGGASEYFGITPDLECFGKAFGNGEAVAFVVGNQALQQHGEIVSGTFSGDVTGLSAVCDTLHTYTTEPVIETIWARGRQLQAGLRQVLPESFATIDGEPPLTRLNFQYADDKQPFAEAMWERGILVYPDWLMTMYAHTEQQINQVIEAAGASWKTLS